MSRVQGTCTRGVGSANFLAARILRKVLASAQWEFLVRQDLKDGKAKVPLDGQLLVSSPLLKVTRTSGEVDMLRHCSRNMFRFFVA